MNTTKTNVVETTVAKTQELAMEIEIRLNPENRDLFLKTWNERYATKAHKLTRESGVIIWHECEGNHADAMTMLGRWVESVIYEIKLQSVVF